MNANIPHYIAGWDDPLEVQASLHDSERLLHVLVNKLPDACDECSEPSLIATLSTAVRVHFPQLWQLGQSVNQRLHEGVNCTIVKNLPFGILELQSAKQALLAFASCIGNPTSADPHRTRLVWEVSPRSTLPSDYTPTITERCGDAPLHTDSAFKSAPENYVMFFAYKSASDGGGLSQFLSTRRLLDSLSKNSDGRKCISLLRENSFPFRVPTVFTKDRSDAVPEWISAPILWGEENMRYRHDLIVSAIESGAPALLPECEWALSHAASHIQKLSPDCVALRSGDLVILNNHQILHGRTSFEDRDRMLLRVRLATAHPSHPVEDSHDTQHSIRGDFAGL